MPDEPAVPDEPEEPEVPESAAIATKISALLPNDMVEFNSSTGIVK